MQVICICVVSAVIGFWAMSQGFTVVGAVLLVVSAAVAIYAVRVFVGRENT